MSTASYDGGKGERQRGMSFQVIICPGPMNTKIVRGLGVVLSVAAACGGHALAWALKVRA